MSTKRAIAAVTEALKERLEKAIDEGPGGTVVSIKPPDKASGKVNLFLYNMAIDASWRNRDLPRAAGQGQSGRPLLPLRLYYLLTAIGLDADDDTSRHDRLGKAMLNLHDQPELGEFSPATGIKNQPDPIRITLQPMSLDEMSKLWSAFQTAYRPSVAYEVAVVLIESEKAAPVPMPVLFRGETDRGWDSTTLLPAQLVEARFATGYQAGALPGETVTLVGQNLRQSPPAKALLVPVNAELRKVLNVEKPLLLDVTARTETEATVVIPDDPQRCPAGLYLLRLQHELPSLGQATTAHPCQSNGLPIAVLPQIVPVEGGLKVVESGDNRTLTLRCRPAVFENQRKSLQVMLGSVKTDSAELGDGAMSDTITVTWTSALEAKLPNGKPDGLPVRLRVDDVDSLVLDPKKPRAGIVPGLAIAVTETPA